jgi:hypothetical protein
MNEKWPQIRRNGVLLAGAAIGVALLLLIAFPYLLNVDHYRATIESAASTALGRQVRIGRLHFSLLTRTLTADDISVADDEAFSRTAFLHARSLAVGVELLPLLFSHTLRVHSLTLDEPQMHLLRSASGKWNYASLGAREKRATTPPPAADSAGGLPSYFVRELKANDGQISIGSVPPGAPEQSFAEVSLVAADISSNATFPVTIVLKAPKGGKITLEGMAGPAELDGMLERVAIHLKFHGQRVGVAGVEGLLQNLGIPLPPGASLRGGSLSADLSVDGPLGRLLITGPVTLSDLQISGFNFATWVGGVASFGGIKDS